MGVAPRAGAWIETGRRRKDRRPRRVAPRAGAWIETRPRDLNPRRFSWSPPARGRGLKLTSPPYNLGTSSGVAPRAGAWIETCFDLVDAIYQASPPARGRGLKRVGRVLLHNETGVAPGPSPPARGRGLKHRSHTTRPAWCTAALDVAPRAGAWIETHCNTSKRTRLKVAPRAGAWIETTTWLTDSILRMVAPRAGAWIETCRERRDLQGR